MRRTALKFGVLLTLALVMSMACALASTVDTVVGSNSKTDPLATVTSVEFRNEDIRVAFATIFHAMDADFLLTDEVTGSIEMRKEQTTVRDILDQICAAKGLHYWEKGGTYIVSTQLPPSDTNAVADITALKPDSPKQLVYSPKKWRSYKASYMHPSDLAALFNNGQSPSTEWGTHLTSLLNKRMDSAARSGKFVDNSLSAQDLGVSRLGESGQFPGMGGGGFGGGFGGGGFGGGGLGGGVGSIGGRTAGTGRSLGQPLTGSGFNQLGAGGLQGLTEDEIALLESGVNINAPFAALLPEGMTAPIAYEPLNYLIFEATDEAYDRFLELVRIFDQKPKQVLLEVQFITLSTSDAFALGMDWFYNIGRTALAVSGFAPAGNINLRVAKGQQFAATLSTLLSNNKARLVNAPRVATMNNYPATISFSDQVPYVDFGGAVAVPNGGTISGGATVQVVNVPTNLTILPRVNGDDSVTALLQPIISTFTNVEVPTPDGGTQAVPLISQSSIVTLLNIKDGETMVIGGFINRNETTNRSKVPLLGDLPIVGALFSRVTKNTSDSELLIFVTPHVIKDEYTAGSSVTF